MFKTKTISLINNYVMAGVIVLGFIVGISRTYYGTGTMQKVYLGLMIILLLLEILLSFGGKFEKTLPFEGLFMAVVTSVITVPYLFQNVEDWITNYGYVIIWGFLLSLLVVRHGDSFIRALLYTFALMMIVLNFENLGQFVEKWPPFYNSLHIATDGSYNYKFGIEGYRTMSYFGHPIPAGLFFAFSFFLFKGINKGKISGIMQLISLVNLYTTQSRSDWIAFAVVYIIFLFPKYNKLMKSDRAEKLLSRIAITIVAFGAVVVWGSKIWTSIMLRFGDTLSLQSTSGSNLQRLGTMRVIFEHFSQSSLMVKLFGEGVGSSSDFMRTHTILIPFFSTTDNQYLTFLFEFGLIGLLGYLFFYVYFFFRDSQNSFSWVGISSVGLTLISQFFFVASSWIPVYMLFVFGTLIGIVNDADKKREEFE
ncbi:O-antigen ligase family protein [Weissella confusa]|uniref:O-antigen ligase family protein n=1 Tax=Weissella confusa TaxID=1583 RepID=UPI002A759935|nr:O-antigen ligase family protein [Weissella confusa]MDY2513072.1 O-antigen ligase family protein [Weissella confusa]